jgi:hypothetical protein
MKEITKDFQESKVEITAEKEQRKEIKLIGQQRRIPGLTLWEFNLKRLSLAKAQFKKEDVEIKSLALTPEALTKRSKVIVNEHCIYFQALNHTNAVKWLFKRGFAI